MRRTVWLLAAAILIAGLLPGYAADGVKKDIPTYDGRAGSKKGDLCANPKDGAEMVWIPAGQFTMGSRSEQVAAFLKEHPEWKAEWFAGEKPQRKVYLDGCWIYKHEVTVAQYRRFCEETGRQMPPEQTWGWRNEHPVVSVGWDDAAAYAKWAGVSLPTEAQWEKAARGTDGRVYPWGNKWDASNSANPSSTSMSSPQPVGSYPSGVSPYGVMDMAGNAWEWCADWYDPDYYKTAPLRNPQGPSKGKESAFFGASHVLRGGSFFDVYCVDDFRCASRGGNVQPRSLFVAGCGFRCAKTP
ncbi:MAG: SUMF1/EgtB/PvdO family nonheme iron enzyme [Armatimonadota bacterium]|nr:SUMF1/EgtB/PvdO family nonheme iron enzyme [Armatimonadota bacterium]